MTTEDVSRAAGRRLILSAAAVLMTLLPMPGVARAGTTSTPEDLAACQDERAPPKARREVCSRLIDDAGQLAEIRAEAYLNRGLAAEALGNEQPAIEDYSNAIKLNPDYKILYHYRGLAYEQAGKIDLAILDYSAAITRDPTDTEALSYRAQAYAKLRSFDKAVADYDELIRQDPTDPDSYAGRGAVLEGMGDKAKAVADFRMAISLAPDNEDAKAGMKRLAGSF